MRNVWGRIKGVFSLCLSTAVFVCELFVVSAAVKSGLVLVAALAVAVVILTGAVGYLLIAPALQEPAYGTYARPKPLAGRRSRSKAVRC